MRPATVVTALAALAVLASAPRPAPATAQEAASRLLFEPSRPVAGQTVTASYRGDGALDGDRLVLRARLRTPRHDSYNWAMKQARVAELRRVGTGEYRGEFVLPEDVVYAVFAVETPAGDRVDDAVGRPWELVVHDVAGRPLYDGLRQRFHDHMGRDLREVLASARQATQLYPDAPGGWSMLHAAQSWSAGAAEAEAVQEGRRAEAEAVAARIGERADLTPDEIAELGWLASGTPAAAEWRARLEREHPDHPAAVMARVSAARREQGESPAELLAVYEEAWTALETRGPPADAREEEFRVSLASMGLRLAAAEGGEEVVSRWAARFRGLAPLERQATTLLALDGFRDEGLEAARVEMARLRDHRPEDRELGHTVADQRRAQDLRLGALKGRVARALLEDGRQDDGVAMLRAAVARRPAVDLLRELGDVELERGDTTAALEAWARTAAHPATATAFADTVRERLGAAFQEARWRDRLAAARADLVGLTRDRALHRPVPGPDLELVDADGARLSLASLTGGAEAAVVVFVSRFCGFSMRAMPEIQALARDVAGQNVVVIPVTGDAVAEDYPQVYRDIDVDIPVYHDLTGDVRHAFNVWGTPQYFILDREGAIRYETGLASIPLELAALREDGG